MKRKLETYSFVLISLIGFFLNIIEITLKAFNRSICEKETCKIVANSVKFGDGLLIIAGIIVFFMLAILLFYNQKTSSKKADFLIDLILILSLSSEGFLTGFQFFYIKTVCVFCLSVFSLFVVLTIIRFLMNRKIVALGFLTYISVLLTVFIIAPPEKQIKPLKIDKYNLFYSENCLHCEKINEFAKKNSIKLNLINAEKNRTFLKILSIKVVPILVVKESSRILIIKGEKQILSFFKNNKTYLKNDINWIKPGTCKLGVVCNDK